jgi:hypothetical protein
MVSYMCSESTNDELPNSSVPGVKIACIDLYFAVDCTEGNFQIIPPSQYGKKPVSRNVSSVCLIIIIFCFISGICELFWKKLIFLVNLFHY